MVIACVRLLIELGTDFNSKNFNGETAADVAGRQYGVSPEPKEEVIEFGNGWK